VPAIAARLLGQADTHLTTNFAVVIGAGLLVGVGTRLANGCTSGHGVCGLSRLSPRGIAATVIYLLAGGISVLLFRHIWGVI
ncbi:MAG: YeeE/YedE thiosulfate transporter family protein, partial [Albidovulum sp.]